MKHKIFLIACIILTASLSSCKKEDAQKTDSYKCVACKTTPDALAANDGSSKGVYKGVVIGSTGTILFDIMNGGTTITATMVLDGTTVHLASVVSWVSGVAYVAPFTGTLNGASITITFKVDANGGNPIVTSSDIPGHATAQFNLVKESSTALIECFEGSYDNSKPETGTFNLLLSRSLGMFGGSSRKTGGASNGDFDGTLSGGVLTMDGKVIGTLSEDQISGTFKDNNGNTIKINAKRTF
jgi:hypothetical protein